MGISESDTSFTMQKASSMEKTKGYITSSAGLDSRRCNPTISGNPQVSNHPEPNLIQRFGNRIYHRRDPTYGQMRSCSPLKSAPYHFFPYTRSPEKERKMAAGNRHAVSQLSLGGAEIQDGRARYSLKDSSTRRLDVHGRSSRWILPHQPSRFSSTLPRFPMARSILRLQGASIWSRGISAGLLKSDEINNHSSKMEGSQNSSISRRFHWFDKSEIPSATRKFFAASQETGPSYISGEVKSRTATEKGVPRANSEHSGARNVLCSSEKEIRGQSGDLEIISKSKSTTPSKKSSKGSRFMYFPVKSGGSNATTDEESFPRFKTKIKLGSKDSALSRSYRGSKMVETCYGALGRENRSTVESRLSDFYRRIKFRMGWYFGRKISERVLDSSDARGIDKLQRTDGCIYVSPGIQERSEEQSYISEDGQHLRSGIHQQDDGTIGSPIPTGKSSTKPNKGAQLRAHGTTHSRSGQHRSGSAISLGGQKRLDAAPKVLQGVRNKMGTSHYRSDGIFYESPSPEVQLIPLGPERRGDRRLFSEVVRREQLRQSAIQSNAKNSWKDIRRRRGLHSYRPYMARSNMVQQAIRDEHRVTDNDTESTGHIPSRILRQRGAIEQPQVGSSGLQSIWRESAQNWSETAQEILTHGLRPATIKHYNAYWKRFKAFCEKNGDTALPANERTLVDFICEITTNLSRPGGTVNEVFAAIRQAHLAANHPDPTSSHLLKLFRSGIINTRTKRAQKKATPVETEPLCNLFRRWPDNDLLPLIQLRKKALALCAFIGMMRPGEPALMEKSKIQFAEDLEWMDVCYLGFKTDGQANGETSRIWNSSEKKLCPVRALYDYIQRVNEPEEDKIFTIGYQRIANILKEVIKEAGMDSKVITARSFRSGGATSGIKNGVNPDQLMKTGRWKTPAIFYDNYVAARPDSDTTDRMLGINANQEFNQNEEEEEATQEYGQEEAEEEEESSLSADVTEDASDIGFDSEDLNNLEDSSDSIPEPGTDSDDEDWPGSRY
jgi:integrase